MLANSYFIIIIALQDSFRNRDTYPVALKAFLDLVFVGLATCLEGAFYRWYFLQNETSRDHEDTIFYCVCMFGFSHMNEISTPMTLLALAIQRYFKVCKPFIANQPKFSRYQKWSNVVVTIVPLIIVSLHAAVIVYRYDPIRN